MRMTPEVREAGRKVIEELAPHCREMSRLAAAHNIRFHVDEVQVYIGWGNMDSIATLSHVEFREIITLSDEAKAGILRTYRNIACRAFNRGQESGRDEIRSGLTNLLGIRFGIAEKA